jgi:hypothetical protein
LDPVDNHFVINVLEGEKVETTASFTFYSQSDIRRFSKTDPSKYLPPR